jgi:glycosyltransferase involved in cell wall biosynthesis
VFIEGEMILSLIIPVYDAERYLDALFQSITGLKGKNMQIIFCDNQSRDSSLDKLRKFRDDHQAMDILVVSESRPGPAAARNRALKEAKGDIICFTDSDCVIDQNWPAYIISFFNEHPEIDLVGGVNLSEFSECNLYEKFMTMVYYYSFCIQNDVVILSKFDWFYGKFVSTSNMAVRRKVIDVLNGFSDWKTAEDMDFWMRAFEHSFSIYVFNSKMLVHHNHRSTLYSLISQMSGYCINIPLILKNHFPGKFIINIRNHYYVIPGITGYLNVNIHLFIALLFFFSPVISVFLYLSLFLISIPAISYKCHKIKLNITITESLKFALIRELLKWVDDFASIYSSLRFRMFFFK